MQDTLLAPIIARGWTPSEKEATQKSHSAASHRVSQMSPKQRLELARFTGTRETIQECEQAASEERVG